MLPIINTHQSWGAAVSFDASVLTLNIKDEPLKTVVKKISEVTGYQIFIDEEWGDLLVTASLKDVSLYRVAGRLLIIETWRLYRLINQEKGGLRKENWMLFWQVKTRSIRWMLR
jgi:type II secretory pathway component GspD/PulD (secretin)